MSRLTGTAPRAKPPAATAPKLRAVYRSGAGELHLDWPVARLDEALHDPHGVLWLDIESHNGDEAPEVESLLLETFGFHGLAIEDALRESHLPKIDDWGDYLYMVFHGTAVDEANDALRLTELDVFIGANYLVTYHTEPLSFLDDDRLSIERNPRDRLRHGADHLLFHFLDRAVDQALTVIEYLDERVDEIQNQVIENPVQENLPEIFRIKRSAIHLHKIFGPQREVLNRLARDPYKPIRAEHRIYFRDVYDHVVRMHDISESLRDLIAGTLETYLSVVSNRTNEIMKTLTMVTVMFLPMSFLAGFFGMNFFGETLAFQTPLPRGLLFVLTLVIMSLSPLVMWRHARKRRWF
jgi:magnesium transporter